MKQIPYYTDAGKNDIHPKSHCVEVVVQIQAKYVE